MGDGSVFEQTGWADSVFEQDGWDELAFEQTGWDESVFEQTGWDESVFEQTGWADASAGEEPAPRFAADWHLGVWDGSAAQTSAATQQKTTAQKTSPFRRTGSLWPKGYPLEFAIAEVLRS